MNAITFSCKRAFLSSLHVSRRACQSFGITAARFDLLEILARAVSSWRQLPQLPQPVPQRELRVCLGVSASVVSRMLFALEGLGLVVREVAYGDRRQRLVRLTASGWDVMRRARRVLVRGMHRIVLDALCWAWRRDADAAFLAMAQAEGALGCLRASFGDAAHLYYPWGHPDD